MTLDEETQRMRRASELALDELDWCVDYFRSIRKGAISDALARNRAAIIRRLVDDEAEDLDELDELDEW